MLKLLVALTVAGTVIPAAQAHERKPIRGCQTRACEIRIVKAWIKKHPLRKAIASVYDAAGGPIACGGPSYGYVVANKSLPCGSRVRICYTRCVTAIVRDRGPFIAGRSFDLSRKVQYAIGFPFGVETIRYRVLY